MKTEDNIAELECEGFCVIEGAFPRSLIDASREAFWPILTSYIDANRDSPNRGPHRHFLPVPFQFPIFANEFFFNPTILEIVQSTLHESAVADQWGCDAPILGSQYQNPHVDYNRPLFPENPDAILLPYMLVVSFGLVRIDREHGPIEIAAGSHRMTRDEAQRAVSAGEIPFRPVPLAIGDVLIRHPWALHRGTPNLTVTPRALLTIRYVRRWYDDRSRDVLPIPSIVWESFTDDQRRLMRFPVGECPTKID
jgi:ectoine hydroxylase-related dioxygenase (phytanoyl-CoA dioxygenase family)